MSRFRFLPPLALLISSLGLHAVQIQEPGVVIAHQVQVASDTYPAQDPLEVPSALFLGHSTLHDFASNPTVSFLPLAQGPAPGDLAVPQSPQPNPAAPSVSEQVANHHPGKSLTGNALGKGTAEVVAASKGALTIVEGGTYSASERLAAETLAGQGRNVVLRPPVGTRAAGGTSDLLVDGVRYDVYTPTTTNASRIISAIAKKNTQAEGIVLDLSQTSVTRTQLGEILKRVNGAGATNIRDIQIIGGN